MGGLGITVDPGAIAQNILVYFGGTPGAWISAAACMICWLFAGLRWLSPHHAWLTMGCVIGAWTAAFAIRQYLGWT